jgi:aryl-alcohol dehydrogenase-like predicted oxidoreductase
MHYRTLGRTGIKVSEIGYGAWGIGEGLWKGGDDGESLRALHRAVDLGLNFIDTALVYGDGHSETLVGKFVKERKEGITVASKIPPKNQRWPARKGTHLRDAFPYDHIISSTEQSLRNLGLEQIDLQQFHVWTDEWTDEAEWYDAITRLKEEGKIRYFGISINDHEPGSALQVGASGKVDAFQVIYNIFDQSPETDLFPLCREKNIGILARVPLDEGGLTGAITSSTTFAPGDFRNNYFKGNRKEHLEARVKKLTPLLGGESATVAELALRFCLAAEAVSTVIPGMRTVRHAEANCRLSDGRTLSASLLQELGKHRWERNFYQRDPG